MFNNIRPITEGAWQCQLLNTWLLAAPRLAEVPFFMILLLPLYYKHRLVSTFLNLKYRWAYLKTQQGYLIKQRYTNNDDIIIYNVYIVDTFTYYTNWPIRPLSEIKMLPVESGTSVQISFNIDIFNGR